jgi:hypothetical protein
MKVIPERDVFDAGYSRNVPYLMQVIYVSGTTFIRYVTFLE